MKRLMLVALALAVVLSTAAGADAASRRSRARIDHYKHYRTCATCPRGPMETSTVIDYGPDGKENRRYWAAAAVNNAFWGHERLFYVWEHGSVWYQHGRCTSKPQWNQGSHVYEQWWNPWHEVVADRNTVAGGGPPHDGHPAYRYRRVEFHFAIDEAGLHKDAHKYVGMTLRCDGTWQPAG